MKNYAGKGRPGRPGHARVNYFKVLKKCFAFSSAVQNESGGARTINSVFSSAMSFYFHTDDISGLGLDEAARLRRPPLLFWLAFFAFDTVTNWILPRMCAAAF